MRKSIKLYSATISLGLVISLLMTSIVLAQEIPAVNISSPTSAALAKYVDYPVNMHTGVPRISIPIHEVNEGPLSLPISLSYHASGLKVQETASWVGAGWSLNAGGMISRTVRGLPDDQLGSLNDAGVLNIGSYLRDKGFVDMFTTTRYQNSSLVPYPDINAFGNGQKDSEPDLFFFNFAGYSGEFYFNEAGRAVTLPQSDLKITPIVAQPFRRLQPNLLGFTVTTTNGTKYHFGVTDDPNDVEPVEKSDSDAYIDPGRLLFSNTYSSWYLYKIESADGLFSIDLSYRSEDFAYYTVTTTPCVPNCDENASLIKVLINGVKLDKIECSNGSVSFIPETTLREDLADYDPNELPTANTEAKALSEIRINSNSSTFCKKFKFDYGYFLSEESALPGALFGLFGEAAQNNVPDYDFFDTKKLKLNSVQELSCDDNTSVPPHRFTYYEPDKLSRVISFSQDHWGFNNGVQTNIELIPELETMNGFEANREAAWPAMRAGTLAVIEYPTGGSSEFIYEPNSVITYPETDLPYSNVKSLSVGFGSKFSEVQEYDLIVTESGFYRIRVSAQGSGSGKLELEGSNVAITRVTTELFDNFGNPIPGAIQNFEQEFFLEPGTYAYKATANADTREGGGINVFFDEQDESEVIITEELKLVGGLRIKEIKQVDHAQTVMTKTFQYDEANLYSIPDYIIKLKNPIFKTSFLLGNFSPDPNGCWRVGQNQLKFYTFASPSSVNALIKTQGYHIGYNAVTETQADSGYSIHRFAGSSQLPSGWLSLKDVSVRSVDDWICLESDPEFPAIPAPYNFTRGNLRAIENYNKDGNLLSSQTYSENFVPKDEITFGMITKIIAKSPDDPTPPWDQGDTDRLTMIPSLYEMRSARKTQVSVVSKTYDPEDINNYVETTSTTFYENPATQLPTRVSTTTSRGVDEQSMRYVPDITDCKEVCPECVETYLAAQEAAKNAYLANIESCRFFTTFSECRNFRAPYLLRNNCNSSKVQCEVASWHEYQMTLNDLRAAYSTCIRNCSGSRCISLGMGAVAEARDLYRMEVTNQIAAPIEITSSRNGLVTNSQLFDFDSQRATWIYLDKVSSFTPTNPVDDFYSITVLGGGYQTDDRYDDIPEADILYERGVIVQTKSRDGIYTSYIWGYNNTLPLVVAVGVDSNTLKTAYQNDPQNLRSLPELKDAQITTYEYDPVVGITAQTDPNGIRNTYHYDDLGRLIQVKDQDDQILQQYEYNYHFSQN